MKNREEENLVLVGNAVPPLMGAALARHLITLVRGDNA